MSDARQYAIWPDPRSRSRGVESYELLPFSKSISSAIFNGSWQMTADSLTRRQYLNFFGPDF